MKQKNLDLLSDALYGAAPARETFPDDISYQYARGGWIASVVGVADAVCDYGSKAYHGTAFKRNCGVHSDEA